MGGDLLVAHVDDPDPLVEAAVVGVDDVPAAQSPDDVDALGPQRLGDELTAGDLLLGKLDITGGACGFGHVGAPRGRSGETATVSVSEVGASQRAPV
jgi:hypothetical protein